MDKSWKTKSFKAWLGTKLLKTQHDIALRSQAGRYLGTGQPDPLDEGWGISLVA